jgi:hypothetical protein
VQLITEYEGKTRKQMKNKTSKKSASKQVTAITADATEAIIPNATQATINAASAALHAIAEQADVLISETQAHVAEVNEVLETVETESANTASIETEQTNVAPDTTEQTEQQPEVTPETEQVTIAPRVIVDRLTDLAKLDEDERARVVATAKRAAQDIAGTRGQASKDSDGNIRRDTLGRVIPVYTPRRESNAVAVDELTRLRNLSWFQAAQAECTAIHAKQKAELTAKQIETIACKYAPKSWTPVSGSKAIYRRMLTSVGDYKRPE